MRHPKWFRSAVRAVDARFAASKVKMTIGGEPSYVPLEPEGAEWMFSALGPTKLRYAYSLAAALEADVLPGALTILSPGKCYPGEVNPRWAIHLLVNRSGSPLMNAAGDGKLRNVPALKRELLKRLKLPNRWLSFSAENTGSVSVLPLDYIGRKGWRTERWKIGKDQMRLVAADGPAGLRLPLQALPEGALKRALVIEVRDGRAHLFLPPLAQKGFLALLKIIGEALAAGNCGSVIYEGYIPDDEAGRWTKLSITPDPGVLEINLPACRNAEEYGTWLGALETCAGRVGLRSFKLTSSGEQQGTGGGNHLLFGGPSLAENPFFENPRWVAAILRYWQRHPALSYLFSGCYVGPSSQAPRPDESARPLPDLELAYAFLEQLPRGEDYRHLIGETLRHLHIDLSGNTHRSEVSFDKFWDLSWAGGCRGLVEFRAVEMLPRADWMAAVALLWTAVAAMALSQNRVPRLQEFGRQLHDRFLLPAWLWADLEAIVQELSRNGFALDLGTFREIWNYRFPMLLQTGGSGAELVIRKALESWPLLCETPQEGGTTSRFVDTSLERLEFLADPAFAKRHRLYVQGRELTLQPFANGKFGAGLRYRRTALQPSLHPGVPIDLPLVLAITDRRGRPVSAFRLEMDRRVFEQIDGGKLKQNGNPCRKASEDLAVFDLRLQ